jgi:serine/threonine-protein kinase RsbW
MSVVLPGPSTAIEVAFPADTANMAIARSVAAAVATRADLTVDQIEDVRLAIDEATAYLIAHASPDARVLGRLWTDGHTFHASLSCATESTSAPEPEPFSWTVLTALVSDIDRELVDGELVMHWVLARDHSVPA